MPGRSLFLHPPRLPLVAPSILSARFTHMAEDCRGVLEGVDEAGRADLLHLDVMDGHFVPNLTMGPDMCRWLRREFPGTFLDVHLMVMQPERFVEAFAEAGADHVTFHAEVRQGGAAVRLAERARSLGMTAGIALNPGTPAWVIRPIVGAFELVLVMSVEPGFSGQRFRGEVVEKVREIRSWVGAEKRVEMDGGIGIAESRVVRDSGCDVIVSASAIFGRGGPERAGVIRGLRGESSRTL